MQITPVNPSSFKGPGVPLSEDLFSLVRTHLTHVGLLSICSVETEMINRTRSANIRDISTQTVAKKSWDCLFNDPFGICNDR